MDPVTPTQEQRLSNYTPQVDATKYIRTYAKDVAMLTNTPIPKSVAPAIPTVTTPLSQTTPASTTESGVTVQEFDSSPTNIKDGDVSPKEFKQEEVTLTASDSDGIFASSMAPTQLKPIAPVPVAEQTEEEKEAVLARLRARLASHQQMPSQASTPEPLIRAAAPDFSTTPEPTLPQIPEVIPKELFVPPTPLPAVPPPAPVSTSGLHTYSGDFADHIDEQKSSTFSVLAAQSDAGQNSTPLPRARRSFLPLIAGGAMLVIGVGAVTGAYIFTHKTGSTVTGLTVPSLVRFDESVEVKGTGLTLMKALANVAQSGSVSGNVVVTYVTGADATSTTGIPQPGGVLIKALSLPAPDILLRNIGTDSTVGTIHAGAESRPFFVVKVSSYERTFAGMLAWEQTMGTDLSILYPPYTSMPDTSASSSAKILLAPRAPTFTDGVVANYNVRILRDATGRSILLYGYRGKDMLIIARDETAFSALISRLNTAGS
jgi:hypothetical protein